MSTPAVVSMNFVSAGYQMCSTCDDMDQCYKITLSVGTDRAVETDPTCATCFMSGGGETLSIQLKVGDVVPLYDKARRQGTNKRAAKRERTCAEEIAGWTTPGSGSGTAKGDARNDEWMIDDKHTTSREAFPIRRSDMIKACGQAVRGGRKAALKVGFPDCDVAVLTWEDFLELTCKS